MKSFKATVQEEEREEQQKKDKQERDERDKQRLKKEAEEARRKLEQEEENRAQNEAAEARKLAEERENQQRRDEVLLLQELSHRLCSRSSPTGCYTLFQDHPSGAMGLIRGLGLPWATLLQVRSSCRVGLRSVCAQIRMDSCHG